jgi:hypothetical protein
MKELLQSLIEQPTLTCFFFLVAYWMILRLIVIVSHLAAGRPTSDGPSLFPANIVWSAIALVIAWPLNLLVPPVGTGLVVCISLGYPFWAFARKPPSSTNQEAQQAGSSNGG